MSITIDRIPKNIEAEQALLSCLMQADEGAAQDIVQQGSEAHFHDPINRTIWVAASTSVATHRSADIPDLVSALGEDGLNAVGGRVALADIRRVISGGTSWKKWHTILEETRYRRAAITAAQEIIEAASDPKKSVAELKAESETAIMALSLDAGDGDSRSVSKLSMSVMERLEGIFTGAITHTGLLTGLPEFDNLLMGFKGSELIIIAARPSTGKSAIAAQIAEFVAVDNKKHVLFFSLEMSDENLVQRQLLSMSRVPMQSVYNKSVTDDGFSRLVSSGMKLSESGLQIIDKSAARIDYIQGAARRIHRRRPLDLIVVDYIQMATGTSKRSKENRVLEISEVSSGLKNLAKELKVPVLALAQLNRDVEDRKGGRPQMSDLKGCGGIEEDADMIGLMHRVDGEYMDGVGGPVEFNWCKHRNGPTGRVQLFFDSSITRFRSHFPNKD